MSTFTIPEEFAGTRLYSGGREYEFDGTEFEADDEADAKRVRIFAVEHPEFGIAEDGTVVGYIPDPEADPEPATAEESGEDTEGEEGDDDDDADDNDDNDDTGEDAGESDDSDNDDDAATEDADADPAA